MYTKMKLRYDRILLKALQIDGFMSPWPNVSGLEKVLDICTLGTSLEQGTTLAGHKRYRDDISLWMQASATDISVHGLSNYESS
jgi:hypothetical protein